MLIKRVYEIDPMVCPRCGGTMKILSFIDPPQKEVVEKILHGHRRAALVGGLWRSPTSRGPPEPNELVLDMDSDFVDQKIEFTCDMDASIAY